jgi:SAM-dependent methyltransferase
MDIRPTAEVKPPAEPVIRAASLLAAGGTVQGRVPGAGVSGLPHRSYDALDIACGTGRHAIWLWQHGWKVTAVDRDVEAIERLRRDHPAIDARVVDLEEEGAFAIDEPYDLVVCWLYHQRDLYPVIRAGVRPGGIVALSARMQGRFAAEPGELRGYFPGWRILHEEENERTCELVAQRSS